MIRKMNNFLEKNRENLWIFLFIVACILVACGCIFVYSSSSITALLKHKNIGYYFSRQLLFAVIGIFLMVFVSGIDSQFIRKHLYKFYFVVMVLLVLVHFVGTGADQVGARSWIRIAGFGLQPSELGKIASVMMLAYILEENGFSLKIKPLKEVLLNIALVLSPIALVLLEPDLGTSLIMLFGLVCILFFTEIKLYYFAVFSAIGVGFLSVFMFFASYRMDRIKSFLNPWDYAQGIGYHIIQSYYAIANGGLLGCGLGNSKQKFLWLPEQHTDFIYSVIIEETGVLGAMAILILFLLLLVLCLKMAINKTEKFERYTIIGLCSILLFQAFLNITVAIGLFPITGVTLPFISYGGSSLISSCIIIGLISALYQDRESVV